LAFSGYKAREDERAQKGGEDENKTRGTEREKTGETKKKQ
jgi:hypothetical protein